MSSPSNQKSDTSTNRLRDHEYDGIREYDNSLPKWWIWLFGLTILFAPVYLWYFHFGTGDSLQVVLRDNLREIAAKAPAAGTEDGSGIDWKDASLIAQGKTDFGTTCAPCHGDAGQGTIGPNLTDKFWMHGGSAAAILGSISNGVVEKGMPAWKPVLGAEKVKGLTAYVLSLKGTSPPGAKPPQGTEEP